MNIHTQYHGDEIWIEIRGAVDFEDVDKFRSLLEEYVLKSHKVFLNCSNCTDLCSMAVGTILGFKIECSFTGGDLWICNASERIREIFDIVGTEGSLFKELKPENTKC